MLESTGPVEVPVVVIGLTEELAVFPSVNVLETSVVIDEPGVVAAVLGMRTVVEVSVATTRLVDDSMVAPRADVAEASEAVD